MAAVQRLLGGDGSGRRAGWSIRTRSTGNDPRVNGRFEGLLEWFSHGRREAAGCLVFGRFPMCSLRTQQRADVMHGSCFVVASFAGAACFFEFCGFFLSLLESLILAQDER